MATCSKEPVSGFRAFSWLLCCCATEPGGTMWSSSSLVPGEAALPLPNPLPEGELSFLVGPRGSSDPLSAPRPLPSFLTGPQQAPPWQWGQLLKLQSLSSTACKITSASLFPSQWFQGSAFFVQSPVCYLFSLPPPLLSLCLHHQGSLPSPVMIIIFSPKSYLHTSYLLPFSPSSCAVFSQSSDRFLGCSE